MISMCTENKVAIWGFHEGKLKMVNPMYSIHRKLDHIKIINDFVYFVFEQGESCLFAVKKGVLHNVTFDRSQEHEDKIVAVDVHRGSGLFVTADSYNLIKIWNGKKDLIREIKFTDEDISSVVFMNQDADLLIGHGG